MTSITHFSCKKKCTLRKSWNLINHVTLAHGQLARIVIMIVLLMCVTHCTCNFLQHFSLHRLVRLFFPNKAIHIHTNAEYCSCRAQFGSIQLRFWKLKHVIFASVATIWIWSNCDLNSIYTPISGAYMPCGRALSEKQYWMFACIVSQNEVCFLPMTKQCAGITGQCTTPRWASCFGLNT